MNGAEEVIEGETAAEFQERLEPLIGELKDAYKLVKKAQDDMKEVGKIGDGYLSDIDSACIRGWHELEKVLYVINSETMDMESRLKYSKERHGAQRPAQTK